VPAKDLLADQGKSRNIVKSTERRRILSPSRRLTFQRTNTGQHYVISIEPDSKVILPIEVPVTKMTRKFAMLPGKFTHKPKTVETNLTIRAGRKFCH
jgi:hypothetical protein